MKAPVAQDGAFAVAPDDSIAQETAYPHQKAENVLQRQKPKLLLSDRIAEHIAGCGSGGGGAQRQGKWNHGPCQGIRGS